MTTLGILKSGLSTEEFLGFITTLVMIKLEEKFKISLIFCIMKFQNSWGDESALLLEKIKSVESDKSTFLLNSS